MIESFPTSPFWLLVLRFLLGSTLLFGSLWLVTGLKLIRNLHTEALLWKGAMLASILLLVPGLTSNGPEIRIGGTQVESSRPADIATNLTSLPLPTRQTTESILVNGGSFDGTTVLAAALPYLLILVWATLTLGSLFFLLRNHKAGLRAMGKRISIDPRSEVQRLHRSLARQMGLRWMPRLTVSSNISTPVTLPGHEICLPDWALQAPISEARTMLAHELGHIRNRDVSWLVGAQLLVSLVPFQPLFRLAQARLTDLAEHIADQAALNCSERADEVAGVLLKCAEKITRTDIRGPAIAMIGKPSRLRSRIDQLLGTGDRAVNDIGRTTKASVIVTMAIVTLYLPGFSNGTRLYAAESIANLDSVACTSESYDQIVDIVHRGTLSPAEGLATWEASCGTESGARIDSTWKSFGLDGHHLWYMAEDGNFDAKAARFFSDNPKLLSTMEFLSNWFQPDDEEPQHADQ